MHSFFIKEKNNDTVIVECRALKEEIYRKKKFQKKGIKTNSLLRQNHLQKQKIPISIYIVIEYYAD